MTAETSFADNGRSLLLEQAVNIWKQKWLALAVAWTVCVVGWIGVMFVPQNYESDARAFVNVDGLLGPLLKGLVVDTTPAQTQDYLQRTLLSRPNLEQVIGLANLGSPSMSDDQREKLVTALGSAIKVTTQGDMKMANQGQNIFSITYTNPNPVKARDVVDAILTVFAEQVAGSSRAEMDKARSFLSGQIASYETQLRAAEQRRADFRKKYAIFFDDSGVKKPELMQAAVKEASQAYDEELAKRNALQAQIAEIPTLLSLSTAPTVGASGQVVAASPQVRLALARRRLAELRLIYTEKHPDVIAAEKSVNDLEAEIVADKKSGNYEGRSEASNPVYEQLRLKLADSQALLPVLKQRLDKANGDYKTALALGGDFPEISAKSQDMDRDYDIIKKNYDELVKRREAANLSQAADDRADRTQFRVVEPPEVPIYPAFPDRLVLFSVVLLVGVGAGALAPIVVGQIRPTFGSPARLRDAGLPVIGAVTQVRGIKPSHVFGTGTDQVFATAGACLVLLYGVLLVSLTGLLKGVL
jgi:polysaccharide chain length determinant protein (PEP-CTERM system associated)